MNSPNRNNVNPGDIGDSTLHLPLPRNRCPMPFSTPLQLHNVLFNNDMYEISEEVEYAPVDDLFSFQRGAQNFVQFTHLLSFHANS